MIVSTSSAASSTRNVNYVQTEDGAGLKKRKTSKEDNGEVGIETKNADSAKALPPNEDAMAQYEGINEAVPDKQDLSEKRKPPPKVKSIVFQPLTHEAVIINAVICL